MVSVQWKHNTCSNALLHKALRAHSIFPVSGVHGKLSGAHQNISLFSSSCLYSCSQLLSTIKVTHTFIQEQLKSLQVFLPHPIYPIKPPETAIGDFGVVATLHHAIGSKRHSPIPTHCKRNSCKYIFFWGSQMIFVLSEGVQELYL